MRRARSAASMRDAIDHELDRVLLLLVERGDVVEPLTIMPSMRTRAKPGLASSSNSSRNSPLRFSALRREQRDLRLRRQRRAARRRSRPPMRAPTCAAALVAALLAGARVEHAQVVVDLGDRADRRARVRRRALLLDGDRRRQAAEVLVLRLLHLAEELPRVRRQRLDVAALALRRRACRTRATTCPSPTRPVNTTSCAWGCSRSSMARLCSRAPRTTMKSGSSAERRLLSDVGSLRLTRPASLAGRSPSGTGQAPTVPLRWGSATTRPKARLRRR